MVPSGTFGGRKVAQSQLRLDAKGPIGPGMMEGLCDTAQEAGHLVAARGLRDLRGSAPEGNRIQNMEPGSGGGGLDSLESGRGSFGIATVLAARTPGGFEPTAQVIPSAPGGPGGSIPPR